MRRVARRLLSAALLASSIGACNALTGASDLTPCGDCFDAAHAPPDATSDTLLGSDGRFVADASDGASLDDAALNDAAVSDSADARDASPGGCQGAVDCTRVVFVSSQVYTGALGGIAGADAKCQALADVSTNSRIKGHTFQAWVSTGGNPVSSRFAHGAQPYVLGNGAMIAVDWNDLIKGALAVPIEIDELGTIHSGNAWTGTTSSGAGYAGLGCNDWTIGSGPRGVYGNVAGAGSGWSSLSSADCSSTNALYCFEK